ncbi:MAG: undecaprenyl-diphosphate phosphatase, partial [Rhodospirillaceae bacterium]|nr:undecaprenyl-diphosphate phosphatase [Rhodospirillaceae bacterium]
YLRSAEVIAWTTLGFGVLLWLVDRLGLTIRRIEHLGVFNALFIGMAQVLALVPGTSRAGVTITAARLLGMERSEAARFSMLMSIPTILGAGLLIGLDLYESGDVALRTDVFLAVGLSFVTALVAIWGLMTWLRRSSFTPFVMYRMLLAAGLFYWIYG